MSIPSISMTRAFNFTNAANFRPSYRCMTAPTRFASAACAAAKTQYWKFETNIPRKGTARPQSQFPHSCVCERFIYSHDRSASYSAAGKYVERSWDYINRSQTHECGNRDWGVAIPFLGIHKWDFRCSAGAPQALQCSPPSTPTTAKPSHWGRPRQQPPPARPTAPLLGTTTTSQRLNRSPVAEVLDDWLGDKVNSGTGLSYWPASHVAWCAGTTTVCRSWLYPPVRDLWIRLQVNLTSHTIQAAAPSRPLFSGKPARFVLNISP